MAAIYHYERLSAECKVVGSFGLPDPNSIYCNNQYIPVHTPVFYTQPSPFNNKNYLQHQKNCFMPLIQQAHININNTMQAEQNQSKNEPNESKDHTNDWIAQCQREGIKKEQNKVKERIDLFVEYVAEYFEEKVSDIFINDVRADIFSMITAEINKWDGLLTNKDITQQIYKKRALTKFSRYLSPKWNSMLFVRLIKHVIKNYDANQHIQFGSKIISVKVKLHGRQGRAQPYISASTLVYGNGNVRHDSSLHIQLDLLFHGKLGISQLYKQQKSKLTSKNRHFPAEKFQNELILKLDKISNNIPLLQPEQEQNLHFQNQNNAINVNRNYMNQCMLPGGYNINSYKEQTLVSNNRTHGYVPVHSQINFAEQNRHSPMIGINNAIQSCSPISPPVNINYDTAPPPFSFLNTYYN